MNGHPQAAAAFNRDEAHVDWHDTALWAVRQKRDTMAGTVRNWESLRSLGSQIKAHTLSNLGQYLEQFEKNALQNGVKVHWAADAREHNRIVESLPDGLTEEQKFAIARRVADQ